MRNTSGLTRAERKANRALRKAQWKKELLPYYLNVKNVSQAGLVYYNLEFNKHGLTPVYDNAG